jgi:hypothetical protein
LSFRVISSNSPRESWIHPGIQARKYLYEIVNRNQERLSTIMDQAMRKDMGI